MTLFWFFWSPESDENGFHHFWSIRKKPTREYLFIQFFTIHILTDN